MHHFFEALTNTSGDSLIGYYARVINRTTQEVVPIFADDSGTPIVAVSGVANMAVTDEYGNLSIYIAPGTYHLDIYAPDAITFRYRVPDVGMESVQGEQGPPGSKGDPGAAGNVADTLAALKAASLANVTMIYDGATYTWTLGDYSALADDSIIVASDNAPLTTGAWVRNNVQLKTFPPAQGGTDAGVAYWPGVATGSFFFGGTEDNGPENDERGYWNYWIHQLGRAPRVTDQGIYTEGGGRFGLAPGNYGAAPGGHNPLAHGTASYAFGVGNVAGSAVASEFYATVSGTTLTVVEMRYGVIQIARPVFGLKTDGSSFLAGSPTISALGTGTGGAGTYTLSDSFNVGGTGTSTGGSPILTAVTGTFEAGQKVLVGTTPPAEATVVAVGSGTLTLDTTLQVNGTGVTVSVIMAAGDYDHAIQDFIGYASGVPTGKNSQAVDQQATAMGEQCETWSRAGVSGGRLARARGAIGNIALGNMVSTSKGGEWSGVFGAYLTNSGDGASNIGWGVNAGSPSDNPIPGAVGISANSLWPVFNVLPGTPGDGNVGSSMSRGPFALWTRVNTTWAPGVTFSTTVTNGGGGGYAELRVKLLRAGVATDMFAIEPVNKYPIFYGDRILRGTARTIPTSSSNGVAGETCWDANFEYTCIATNSWRRIGIVGGTLVMETSW